MAGLIEHNAALRHDFERERVAQTETKEVDILGSGCRLCRHGTIWRKHSDERGRISRRDRRVQ
jgi:L-lactate utilization protein LutC